MTDVEYSAFPCDRPIIRLLTIQNTSLVHHVEPLTQTPFLATTTQELRVSGDAAFEQIERNLAQINALNRGALIVLSVVVLNADSGGGGSGEVTQAELDALQAQVDAIPQPKNYRAATALNAYKLVTTDSTGGLIYADAATPSHVNRIVGLTVSAAASGADCTVESSGQVSNAGWSWPVGAMLFVGLNGAITTDPNIGNFCQQIGYASSSTTAILTINRGIRRAI